MGGSIDLSHRNKNYEGTSKYMSINKADNGYPNKQSDLEELLYTLIYLHNLKLPWDNIKIKNHIEECKEKNKIKKDIEPRTFCAGLPEEFIILAYYILKLNANDEPCYKTMINLLNLSQKEFNEMDSKKNEIFSFRNDINKKFSEYKESKLYDNIGKDFEFLFGNIPIDKESFFN
jgi:hypothetical protein